MLDEHTLRHRELLWESTALERRLPDEYRGQIQSALTPRSDRRTTHHRRRTCRELGARLLSH